jgi:hypothetical protein
MTAVPWYFRVHLNTVFSKIIDPSLGIILIVILILANLFRILR